jgi:hypothetical protein
MNRFKFLHPEWREIEAHAWVTWWADCYDGADNPEYFDLIKKQGKLSGEDYEQIGKWKEGCLKPNPHGRWKTGTPVAYDVWMEAKKKLPKWQEGDDAAEFLTKWSEERFLAGKRNGQDLKHKFGLSRATTLLHFISSGRYPIIDSRVKTAMTRLGFPIGDTTEAYLKCFCPRFSELAAICGVAGIEGLRTLDNALFNYGVDRYFPTT